MAVLNEQDRVDAWARFMQDNGDDTPFTKADVRAAIDATDEWIVANQASFVAALPAPFQNLSTLDQKVRMFTYVVGKRWMVEV